MACSVGIDFGAKLLARLATSFEVLHFLTGLNAKVVPQENDVAKVVLFLTIIILFA